MVGIFSRFALCTAALLAIAFVNNRIASVNSTTAALYMLLVVLAAATRWGLAESIYTSIIGLLSFNFFFLPPLGTFTIEDPANWAALFAFVITAVTASKLSSNAKHRAEEALAGRYELARLYELSRALLMDEGHDTVRHSVMQAGQILHIAEIAFFDAAGSQTFGTVQESSVSSAEMSKVAETGEAILRPPVAVIPVRLGSHIIGSLATVSGHLTPGVRDSVAGLLAINYERARALERAAAAEVAKRNEEFKSSLLDGLAHDLKTPLTSIRTCVTHMIAMPPRTAALRDELLSIIDGESQRLQATITEAIELARIESRELHLERELIPLATVVESSLEEVRDENRSRYSYTGPRDLEVAVDVNLIRKALLQVLENAKKYASPKSPVRIEFAQQQGDVLIQVMDRGPGFHPDELDRIFEKFYRGRRRARQVEGTGMGLAIARGIIEAHGGSIRAQNREGGGAVIAITLPFDTRKE